MIVILYDIAISVFIIPFMLKYLHLYIVYFKVRTGSALLRIWAFFRVSSTLHFPKMFLIPGVCQCC